MSKQHKLVPYGHQDNLRHDTFFSFQSAWTLMAHSHLFQTSDGLECLQQACGDIGRRVYYCHFSSVRAGRGGGGHSGVPSAVPVLHGCGTRRSYVCLHHGHWKPALPVSRVLVRTQRGECVGGRAVGLCGECPLFLF